MTVYVDSIQVWPNAKHACFKGGSCHMATDASDLAELHALAQRIGLRRSWFQPHPLLDHYDLTPGRRAAAMAAGAAEVSAMQLMRTCGKRRLLADKPLPEVARMRNLRLCGPAPGGYLGVLRLLCARSGALHRDPKSATGWRLVVPCVEEGADEQYEVSAATAAAVRRRGWVSEGMLLMHRQSCATPEGVRAWCAVAEASS